MRSRGLAIHKAPYKRGNTERPVWAKPASKVKMGAPKRVDAMAVVQSTKPRCLSD